MGPIIAIFSIFFAAFPLLLVAMVIWAADVYNRKPIWTGIVALAWGAFIATTSAIVISGIASLFLDHVFRVSAQNSMNIQVVIIAPTMEEITKGLILVILMLVPRGFESGTNGLVLGAMAGFGFAITENFMYYIGAYMTTGVEGWIATIILRTLFTTFIHVMASGIIGFCLGLGASRGHSPLELPILLIIGYTLAVAIHMVWNLSATLYEQVDFGFLLLGIVSFMIAAFFMLTLGLFSVYIDRQILEREFEDEIQHGTLNLEDTFILTRWTRRDALKFIFPGKLSSEFQKTALRLAVVKNQNRCYQKQKRDHEIETLRMQLREMKNYSMIRDPKAARNREIESYPNQPQGAPGMETFPGQNPFAGHYQQQRQQSISNLPAGYRHREGNKLRPQFPQQEYEDQQPDPQGPIRTAEFQQPEQDPYSDQPFVGMTNMPQRPPEYEELDEDRPPAPHSISIINPGEFRKRVRKENNLEQERDFDED